MKFVDEFRDPAAARALVKSITELATGDHFKFMEVCGGHTHTIYRHGIEHLLPETVELVHGPGCPVCVIPMGRVDDAMWLAEQPGVIFTTFGDMMRVPGSKGNLIEAKARGADVRFVYSPLDALKVAIDNPDRHVVFFAVGFETTAPSTAVTLVRARALGVKNFSVLLQPRHDRSADQGDPRIARPAAVGFPRARPCVDGGGDTAVPVRSRGVRKADGGRGFRAAGHPRVGAHAAAADPRGPLRGREPVHARGAPRGQHPGTEADVRDVRAAAALRMAWAGLHLAERAEGSPRLRRVRRGAASSRCPACGSPTPRRASAARCSRASSSRGSARCSAPPAHRKRRSARAWSPPRAPARRTTTSAGCTGRPRSCWASAASFDTPGAGTRIRASPQAAAAMRSCHDQAGRKRDREAPDLMSLRAGQPIGRRVRTRATSRSPHTTMAESPTSIPVSRIEPPRGRRARDTAIRRTQTRSGDPSDR